MFWKDTITKFLKGRDVQYEIWISPKKNIILSPILAFSISKWGVMGLIPPDLPPELQNTSPGVSGIRLLGDASDTPNLHHHHAKQRGVR